MQKMAESLSDVKADINAQVVEFVGRILLIVRLRFWFWMDYSLTTFARGYRSQRARIATTFI